MGLTSMGAGVSGEEALSETGSPAATLRLPLQYQPLRFYVLRTAEHWLLPQSGSEMDQNNAGIKSTQLCLRVRAYPQPLTYLKLYPVIFEHKLTQDNLLSPYIILKIL